MDKIQTDLFKKCSKELARFCCLFILLTFVTIGYAANKEIYSFSTPAQQMQFRTLTNELRCLVCQDENLANSTASFAANLRVVIANKINEGESNKAIIQFLVSRYGDYILYKPPVTKKTWVLWFGPFVLLLIGLVILFFIIYLLRRRATNEAEITDDERLKIKRLLAQMEEQS